MLHFIQCEIETKMFKIFKALGIPVNLRNVQRGDLPLIICSKWKILCDIFFAEKIR